MVVSMVEDVEEAFLRFLRRFEHIRRMLAQLESRKGPKFNHLAWPPDSLHGTLAARRYHERAFKAAGELDFDSQLVKSLTSQYGDELKDHFMKRTPGYPTQDVQKKQFKQVSALISCISTVTFLS